MGGRKSRFAVLMLLLLVAGVSSCGNDDEMPPAPQCGIFPEPCVDGSMCCSGICAIDVCTCTPQGAPCLNDSECCDGTACVAGVCGEGCRANGARCSSNQECCSGGCEGAIGNCAPARCNTAGESCASSADCCNDLACRDGACSPGCGLDGASCMAASDCCGGYSCDLGGDCVRACAEATEVCDPKSGRICCAGSKCVDGICRTCSGRGYTCSSAADCCERMSCESGVCTCQQPDASCSSDSDCCPGSECFAGICACAGIGQRCETSRDCCNEPGMDLVCTGGECRPATCHPNTWVCADPSDCCNGGCENGGCCGAESTNCESSVDSCCGGLACWSDSFTCRACGKPGQSCAFDRECCSGACNQGSCRALLHQACGSSAECELLAACENGACCGTTNDECKPGDCCSKYTCAATTHCEGLPGAPCQSDTDCYDDYPTVGSNCVSGACCYRTGTACTAASDCCSGVCVGGKCGCSATGKACDFTVDCCSDVCNWSTYSCDCGTNGAKCASGADCCSGYQCLGGSCCGAPGQTCQSSADCCSGSCKGTGTCG